MNKLVKWSERRKSNRKMWERTKKFQSALGRWFKNPNPRTERDQIGYKQLISFRRKVNSLCLKFIIKERKEKWMVNTINHKCRNWKRSDGGSKKGNRKICSHQRWGKESFWKCIENIKYLLVQIEIIYLLAVM